MNYLEKSMEIKKEIIENRRFLHQNPELGMHLPTATKFVMEKLTAMGYEPKEVNGGGVTALLGKENGKVILLRADMDALPMTEDSGLDFASKFEGKAHTCGHDMHTAMLLGAAKILKENEENLEGQVKFMFQPGEETLEGAASMIKNGILENPKVNAAMAMHMIPLVHTGVIAYGKGAVSASCNIIKIIVKGKGGHGARPNDAIDPINVAAHIHIALQELISREVDPGQTVALTIGSFNAGTKENIIPEEAVMQGTLRTYDKAVQEFLVGLIKDICEYTAKAFRATAVVEFNGDVCALVANPHMVDVMDKAFKEMVGPKAAVLMDKKMNGSEDFAMVADKVPSMCFVLGGGGVEEGYTKGIHHPQTRYNEDCLPIGAAAYAQGATRWLEQSENA
ncbi:MAG: M20 family metallopeptidase [Oscillospiraceae bacterium]